MTNNKQQNMKVLFIASGNKRVGGVSAFVRSQFESLQREGLDMMLYPVTGHGLRGYLRHLRSLRKLIKTERPDIIHAHYSTCGILAWLAALGTHSKIFVSILGSFPNKSMKLYRVRFFIKHIWSGALAKSQRTAKQLGLDLPIVPNGVNLSQFVIAEQKEARKQVGFADDKKYVIFVSNPARVEKNWSLAEQAVKELNRSDVELVAVFDKPHDEVVKYMCAADVLLMTSLSEGSPNVIKEAMACNCPIVTTDVGDVHERLDGLEGCYVAKTYDPHEIATLLKKTIAFGGRTDGRNALLAQHLTSEQVAQRLIDIYRSLK